jgi:hypothetical protein
MRGMHDYETNTEQGIRRLLSAAKRPFLYLCCPFCSAKGRTKDTEKRRHGMPTRVLDLALLVTILIVFGLVIARLISG